MALYRGTAHRRSDAPARAAGRRALRQDAAESEWCAAAAHHAVEVRLQGPQVDRRDQIHRAPAANGLEYLGAARVRLLCQRESERRSPALEPGARAAHRPWTVRVARPDADVQRLREGSCVAVPGNGSEEELLMPSSFVVRRVLK